MTKIKYVGLKQGGETAFAAQCGLERWMPGASHDVADAQLVERMLRHPDVFALGDAKAPKLADAAPVAPPAPTEPPAVGGVLAPGAKVGPATDPLDTMDDASVRAFAKGNGLKVVGIGLMRGKNLRSKVAAALAEKAK